MRNLYKIFLSLSCFLLVIACEKEDNNPETNTSVNTDPNYSKNDYKNQDGDFTIMIRGIDNNDKAINDTTNFNIGESLYSSITERAKSIIFNIERQSDSIHGGHFLKFQLEMNKETGETIVSYMNINYKKAIDQLSTFSIWKSLPRTINPVIITDFEYNEENSTIKGSIPEINLQADYDEEDLVSPLYLKGNFDIKLKKNL